MIQFFPSLLAQKKEQLLLDEFPNAAAAYSLRLLSSSYTGNCIEVRRSSDNALQNIGFVNGVLDTASLLSFVGAGNGFVRTWYDQGNNGWNIIQPSNSNQPRIVSSGVAESNGGLPSVFFNTLSPSFFQNNNLANQTNLTSFRVHDTNRTIYIMFSTAGAGGFNYGFVAQQSSSSTNIFQGYGSPQLFVNGNTPSPLITRNDVYVAQNGRKLISELGSTLNWQNSTFRIGGYGVNFDFTGHLPELVFYSSNKLSDRTSIEQNINSYYNIF
jgi:hypothetical protein